MRVKILSCAAALAAASALVLSGCASNASKAKASAAATAGSSAPVQASCLAGSPDKVAHVTHFSAGTGAYVDNVEAYTTGDGPIGVVLAHQADNDLCQWEPIRPDIVGKGYKVMAITMGNSIDADVVEAVKQLRAQGATKIFLIGASMGGTAVLTAAAEATPPVQGVVSISGPQDYGPALAMDKVKTLQSPVAFFAGKDDNEFASAAQAMYDATPEKDKKIHIIDSSSHGVDLWPVVGPEVLDFLAKHAG